MTEQPGAKGVTVAGVEKRFGDVWAVRSLDLTVDPGEFVVLLGPSGCGKTTVLRTIAGLEDPDAGEIRIGGQLVNDVEPAERDIAMVFQNYALYPHMSVRENMGFGLKMRNRPRQEIAATIESEVARLLPDLPEGIADIAFKAVGLSLEAADRLVGRQENSAKDEPSDP